jgi:hypothetical protein
MKKTIILITLLLLIATAAQAQEIRGKKPACNPSNVCDRVGDIWDYLGSHQCGSCQSGGEDIEELQQELSDVKEYIDEHEDAWLSDDCTSSTENNYYQSTYKAGGLNRQALGNLLTGDKDFFYTNEGDFEAYLYEKYLNKMEYYDSKLIDLETRVYRLQRRVFELEEESAKLKESQLYPFIERKAKK